MNEEALKWVILNRRTLLHTPIYDVLSQTERAADAGLAGAVHSGPAVAAQRRAADA